MTALGPGGEFDRIRLIWQRLGPRMQGGGDDCAIVDIGGERLALSSDLSIENVHFKLGWLDAKEVGWRATAAALSDLAAVAATPLGILVSLGVSEEWPEEHVADLMAGAAAAAGSVGAVVWGGDLTRNEQTIVNVTVVGRLEGRPVLRSGASPGDELWVTGMLGGPASALASWQAGREPEETARERFVHPMPRVAEAIWLRERGVKAMIDLSDGLAADASHLAAASGARCVIEADRVPVHGGAMSPSDVLTSGEEYELLVALAPDKTTGLAEEFRKRFGLELSAIGKMETGHGVSVTRQGKPVEVAGTFQHF